MTKQKLLLCDSEIEVKPLASKRKIVFKPYSVAQDFLLPVRLISMIPNGHTCFLLSDIIDSMDITFIIDTYKGGGTSSYEPKMMLKCWILGFVDGIYSSRRLAKSIRENLVYVWISGNQRPDFRTLNDFRLRMKEEIKIIFKKVIIYGIEMRIIEGKDVFIDHSKKEANSNKHKIVWKKQVERRLANIDKELDELFSHIDELNEKEDVDYKGKDLPENERKGFDKEKVKKIISRINQEMKEGKKPKEEGKSQKEKIKRALVLTQKKADYLEKKSKLGNRNSYSKTDNDAVAMLQKDKLSIKPSYNEGIVVENGFVIDYIISNNSNDAVSFIPLMEGAKENLGHAPESATADAIFGTEENYSYIEKHKIGNFLKYPLFRKEQSKKWRDEKLRFRDFIYNESGDSFSCKNGATLNFVEEIKETTARGYAKLLRNYRAEEGRCNGCPFREKCTTSRARTLQVSWEMERFKKVARENLSSEKGIELRKRRGNEVESVFGDSKLNKNHRRYILRGLKKVSLEAGLHYIAHNIKKIKRFFDKKPNKDIYSYFFIPKKWTFWTSPKTIFLF